MTDTLNQLATLIPESLTSNIKHSRVDHAFQWLRWQTAETVTVTVPTPVGDLSLLVPNESHFYESVSGGQIYEPGLSTDLVNELSTQSIFYDVGSQFGYFSTLANLIGVKDECIHAFEGQRFRSFVLRANHSDDEVRTLNDWVGSNTEGRFLALDDYARSASIFPTHVKIDVEGAEADVLRGMTELLLSPQPVVYIEVHPQFLPDFGSSAAAVQDMLRSFDYHLWARDHRDNAATWAPLDEADLPRENAYLVKAVSETE